MLNEQPRETLIGAKKIRNRQTKPKRKKVPSNKEQFISYSIRSCLVHLLQKNSSQQNNKIKIFFQKTAGKPKSKDQVKAVDLSTERPTPEEGSPAVQVEPDMATDDSGDGVQTTETPALDTKPRIKVKIIEVYPPRVAPRAVNPEVFAVASTTPLPFDDEFGNDVLYPRLMSPPPSIWRNLETFKLIVGNKFKLKKSRYISTKLMARA